MLKASGISSIVRLVLVFPCIWLGKIYELVVEILRLHFYSAYRMSVSLLKRFHGSIDCGLLSKAVFFLESLCLCFVISYQRKSPWHSVWDGVFLCQVLFFDTNIIRSFSVKF